MEFPAESSQMPARVAELVDARDLKSLGTEYCAGSIPAPGTKKIKRLESAGRP